MKEIILIEIISFASFLYSIATLFFAFAPINQMILLFLWTVIISSFYAINKNRSILYKLSILLILLPVLYFKEIGARYFIIGTGILMFLYGRNSVLKGKHYDYVSKFKLTFLIYVIGIYIRSLLGNISGSFRFNNPLESVSGSLTYAAPFLILYILTSILLTRLIRHTEFNKDTKAIRRLNIKYLVTTGIVFITMGVEEVRKTIVIVFSKVIDVISLIIFYPMYWITRFIKVTPEDPGAVDETSFGIMEEGLEELAEEDFASAMEKFQSSDLTMLKRIMSFILLGLLIYLVYRLLMKTGSRQYDNSDYTEEREYIRKGKNKKKRNIFTNLMYPRELNEQVRYYYRKYLRKLEGTDVEVLSSDTSLDVNKKAKKVVEGEIEEIRNIYINTRYGNKNVDEETVEKIKELYKKL